MENFAREKSRRQKWSNEAHKYSDCNLIITFDTVEKYAKSVWKTNEWKQFASLRNHRCSAQGAKSNFTFIFVLPFCCIFPGITHIKNNVTSSLNQRKTQNRNFFFMRFTRAYLFYNRYLCRKIYPYSGKIQGCLSFLVFHCWVCAVSQLKEKQSK